jgi:hypothetical protein
MLTYLLALVVALGSFALYMSAFFYPEVHRRGDLVWSGVGLFYALVLWVCADRITGGVLLGQMASVSLIGWFGYQALTARLGTVPSTSELQAKVSEVLKSEKTAKWVDQGKQLFTKVRDQVQSRLSSAAQTVSETTASEPYKPLTREDFGNPPVTVEPKGETATTPATDKPDVMGTIGTVTGAVASLHGVFGGIFKKPEKNTEVYVRKDYREESAAPAVEKPAAENDNDAFDFKEEIVASETAVEAKTVPIDENGASESTIETDAAIQAEVEYESSRKDLEAVPPSPPIEEVAAASAPIEEPIAPNPPSEELVEAAIEDAEKKELPADPPESKEDTEDWV